MIIPIIGRSAAEFWLGPGAALTTTYAFNSPQKVVSFTRKFDFQLTADLARMIADRLGLTLPLETFSFKHIDHRHNQSLHVFTRCHDLPPNSFIHIKLFGHDLAIARPEFCFLQAARTLDIPHLVYLGMRLCAQYYLQPEIMAGLKTKDHINMVHKNRMPVTTALQIRQFLDSAEGEYGIKKARRAARFIINDSNSQMESAIATIMILPVEFGGYGLPTFTMNEPIDLSQEAIRHYRIDTLRGDFLWKKQRVIVEYNSNAFHMDPDQQARDADRINAMQQSDYRVIPITYSNLKHFDSVENQMIYLMEILGCANLIPRLQDYVPIRKDLCQDLLGTKPDFYENFQK